MIMGSTANRQIPYVEPTGKLAEFPAADKAQAERLDALFGSDSGWVNMTLGAGYAVQSGWTPQVRRIGNVVYARGGISSAGVVSGTNSAVIVIPTGYRPVGMQCVGAAGTNSANTPGIWITSASGSFTLFATSTLAQYYLLPAPYWFLD